ncbi:MAG: ATP-binding protein, partial [Planctomycetota bacterium]
SGLPGLLWRSHLAMGLKDLRRGSLRESAWGFSTALRLFRECHAPGSPALPASLRERPDFRALGTGIRQLAARVTGSGEPTGEDTVASLQDLLTTCALELSGHSEGGGKWERGIEKILSVSETLNSTVKLDPLLEHVVESVLDLCDAEYGFMVLIDGEGEPAIRVARGGFNGSGESAENQVSNTLIRRVLDRRRSILIENALDEKDLVDKPSVQTLSLQAIMCAPLIVKDKLLGAILVDNRTAAGCFTSDDLRLLEVFASQAAAAIQNTRLFEDLEDSYRSLEDAQERLVRSEKLKSLGVLAGGIAHDFNNLLMSILGNADLALMYLDAASPANKRVSEIKNAARLAGDLCSQLLAYSGRGQFVVGALDLSDAVRGVGEMLKVSLPKKVILTSELAEGLPGIEADATQVRQVILNLITNAAEACGDDEGMVFIGTRRRRWTSRELAAPEFLEVVPEGDYVCLEVRDNGCGMDDEARSRLFEPFFTTKFTGRGLGLSAVLGIVRAHQGTIRVETEPGEGTNMTVLFPATEAAVESAAPPPPAHVDWKGTGTVLLVDDEAMVREVAREMLRAIGLTVVAAGDGLEALSIFSDRAGEFDLVVLDMNMPKMSGDEVFRKMREIRPDARVVISSGYSEADTVRAFADDAPAGFLEKPYAFSALREKLHSLLGGDG